MSLPFSRALLSGQSHALAVLPGGRFLFVASANCYIPDVGGKNDMEAVFMPANTFPSAGGLTEELVL